MRSNGARTRGGAWGPVFDVSRSYKKQRKTLYQPASAPRRGVVAADDRAVKSGVAQHRRYRIGLKPT